MSDNVMTRERPDVGSYDDIVAAAVRTTGLTDFGGTQHEEGLRILAEDLASLEAGLTPRGNYFHRSEVKSALVGVLLTQAAFERFPQHADVPIERPIFVMGLPRTGTTALHRLLHADPQAQGLEMWLTQYPQPRPPRDTWDDDPIFQAMQAGFAAYHVESPTSWGSTTWTPPPSRSAGGCCVSRTIDLLPVAGAPAGLHRLAARQDWTDAYARDRQDLELVGSTTQKRWLPKDPSALFGPRRADGRLSGRDCRPHPPRPGCSGPPSRSRCRPDARSGSRRPTPGRDDRTDLSPTCGRARSTPTTTCFPPTTTRSSFVRGPGDRPDRHPRCPASTTTSALDLTPSALAVVEEIERRDRSRAARCCRTATTTTASRTTGLDRAPIRYACDCCHGRFPPLARSARSSLRDLSSSPAEPAGAPSPTAVN